MPFSAYAFYSLIYAEANMLQGPRIQMAIGFIGTMSFTGTRVRGLCAEDTNSDVSRNL